MKNEKGAASGNRFHRKSYFGPIFLITIGLVFLAKNLGLIPGEGWGTIWRLWPILLIIGGIDDLFRREGVAWPVLMIGIGGLLLYNYFGPGSWFSWTQILQLWPVLIIAVGIDIFFRGQTGWQSLVGIFLSVVLIGAAVMLAVQGVQVPANYLSVEETYLSSVNSASVDLSLDVGEFILGAEPGKGDLISCSVTPTDVLDELDQDGDSAAYELRSTKPAFFPHTARWELEITPELPIDLSVDNSVGEMRLDLYDLELDSLYINQGVGRMVVNLPGDVSEDVTIKQGVGVIEVEIPEDVRILVDAQNGLTRVDFPADFELDDGFYSSPGASETNADLLIVVEQGVGLVTFKYPR